MKKIVSLIIAIILCACSSNLANKTEKTEQEKQYLLIKTTTYNADNEITSYENLFYDENNNLIETKRYMKMYNFEEEFAFIKTYEFDENNLLIREEQKWAEGYERYEYLYNEEGVLVKTIRDNNISDIPHQETTYNYEDGVLVSEKDLNGVKYGSSIFDKEEVDGHLWLYSYEYDNDKNLIRKTKETENNKYEYEYDTNGNLIKELHTSAMLFSNSTTTSGEENEYNEKNLLIKKTLIGRSTLVATNYEYEYDENNCLVKLNIYYDNGDIASYTIYEYVLLDDTN